MGHIVLFSNPYFFANQRRFASVKNTFASQKHFLQVMNIFLLVYYFATPTLYTSRNTFYPARALRALGLLLADGAPTVGGGKTF